MSEGLKLALEAAKAGEDVLLAAGCVHQRDHMRWRLVDLGATPEVLRRIKIRLTGRKVGETAPPIEDLGIELHVDDLSRWIGAIAFEAWPQQNRLADGRIRPAMVNDLYWQGFGKRTDALVARLTALFPNCEPHNRMLSVVMPKAAIDPHRDQQEARWVTRVHVPLLTNWSARMLMNGLSHHLSVGRAYRIDTRIEHAIVNGGETQRVHFMVDLRRISLDR
jgi:hypothetical protein